jgi:hypothetical protein
MDAKVSSKDCHVEGPTIAKNREMIENQLATANFNGSTSTPVAID